MGVVKKIREMEQISKLRLVCSLHHLKKEKHDKLKNRRGSSILKTRKKKGIVRKHHLFVFSCFLGVVVMPRSEKVYSTCNCRVKLFGSVTLQYFRKLYMK